MSALAGTPLIGIVPVRKPFDAAGAFTSIFGAPNLTGANVGFATVNAQTQAVPEPGTWMMMLAGFGAAGFALRRSRRRMVLATARA